jgi:ABC-type branched-subunit amino acid transport system substrate-binding protein
MKDDRLLSMTRRRLAGALALTFACSALAACSEEASSSADTIKLMTIAPISTSLQNYPDAEGGARAAVEALNDAGGINGKKIDWVFCNTESDPNKATACSREAVADGVVAVVGQVDVFSPNTLPLLEEAGIPSIGFHGAGNPIDYTSSAIYPLQGGNPAAYGASGSAVKQLGGQRVAVVYTDVPAGEAMGQLITQSVENTDGLTVAGPIPIPASGITDYSPYAQKIEDLGADSVVLSSSAASTGPLLRAAEGLGIQPIWVHNGFSFGVAELEAMGPLADNITTISPFPPSTDDKNPGIAEYNKQLDAAGVGDEPIDRRPSGINAWLSVHAAAEVIEGIEGEVSRESLTQALSEAESIDLFGLVAWSPSVLGEENEEFPRVPPTEQSFYRFDGDRLIDAGLDPVEDSLAGIKP